MNRLVLLVLLLVVPASAQARLSDFSEVWETVRREFYDEKLGGLDWEAVRAELEPRARLAGEAELPGIISAMLARLKTSHVAYYHRQQPEYYQLLAVFDRGDFSRRIRKVLPEGPVYVGLGLTSRELDGKSFVSGVLEGGPGQEAGVLEGDELLAPLPGGLTEGRPVALQLRRQAGGPELELKVTPRRLDGRTMFLHALKKSLRVEEVEGRKVAYAHLWSYASDSYQQALEEALLDGPLKEAEALVLDLRGGWGGASPDYLSLFNARLPSITFIGRQNRAQMDSTWRKPLVLLVDETSRSGKEILAFGVRRYALGRVVGARTAGAVVFGRPYLLKSGNLLYLAVGDALIDGERLEGVGVEPDLTVDRALPYSAGRDPQREAALREAARMIQDKPEAPRSP